MSNTKEMKKMVAARLFELHKDYVTKSKIYDDYLENYESTSKEINIKRQALDAFVETVTLFEDQIKLQEKYQREEQPHEVKSLIENVDILRSRLKSLSDCGGQLKENLRQQVGYNRTLERDMHSLKPEVIQLFRQKEKHWSWLASRGVNPALIAQLLNSGDVDRLVNGGEDYPHHDEATWLLKDCSRNDAERYLAGCQDGTFLIRPSRTGQSALSIICNGSIGHCIIYKTDRGYGFAEPYNIYLSLKALVLHYSQNSLEQHNDSLTTTLAIPVLAAGGSKVAMKELNVIPRNILAKNKPNGVGGAGDVSGCDVGGGGDVSGRQGGGNQGGNQAANTREETNNNVYGSLPFVQN